MHEKLTEECMRLCALKKEKVLVNFLRKSFDVSISDVDNFIKSNPYDSNLIITNNEHEITTDSYRVIKSPLLNEDELYILNDQEIKLIESEPKISLINGRLDINYDVTVVRNKNKTYIIRGEINAAKIL